MTIFRTQRLYVQQLKTADKKYFIELLSDPEIIDSIPQPVFKPEAILKKFNEHKDYSGEILDKNKIYWGVYEAGKAELIGLCMLLTNNDNDRELGYRFRKKYWNKGYGTELTKGMLDFSLLKLNIGKITADVSVENIGSVKILEKFLNPVKEFHNERDGCMDRRYELLRKDWIKLGK